MRSAERGRANHWVARLAGARRLDLHSNRRDSRPVVLQITLEPALRQTIASLVGPILWLASLRSVEAAATVTRSGDDECHAR